MPHYRIDAPAPATHRWHVTLELPRPAAEQVLELAAWAPGSYVRRDFARHVMAISATQRGRAVPLAQRDLCSWVARCSGSAKLVVRLELHALDDSVRACWLDADRGFINGPALFLRAAGHEQAEHTVAFGRLPRGWAIHSAMTAAGPRRFTAANHGELIDHPFALGPAWHGRFTAGGVEHDFVVQGAWPTFDGERLLADARRICETQIRFWHGRGRPPFERYLFLLHASDDGYGGLEHRASTALACTRRDLPVRGGPTTDGYLNLLALVSHEYFHAWNVIRLRPRDLSGAPLSHERPTPVLWFFEGFTAYYDELMLLRAGLVDRARWLRQAGKAVNAVLASPGRHVQSVAAASFDAWTRYYRRDANSPNATVSYYDKGSLVALLADLALRREGGSLDAAMRTLWRRAARGPVDEEDLFAVLPREARAWVRGTAELPLAPALAAFGIRWRHETPSLAAQLGLRLSESALGGVQVKSVLAGSAAEAAGLAPGDEILAADGWRLRRLDELRQWVPAKAAFTLTVTRDQRLITLRVKPPATPAAPQVVLADDDRAGAAALALRQAWLGG